MSTTAPASIRDAPRLAAATNGLELGEAADVDGMIVALLGHRVDEPAEEDDAVRQLVVTMSVINDNASTQSTSWGQIGAMDMTGAPLTPRITADPALLGGVMMPGAELRGEVRFDLGGTTGPVTISYTDILGGPPVVWSVEPAEADKYRPGPAYLPAGTGRRGDPAEFDGRTVTLLSLREAPAALPPARAGRVYVLVDVAVRTDVAFGVTQNQFQLSDANGYVAARTMVTLGEDALYGLLPDETFTVPSDGETVVQLAFEVARESAPFLFVYEDPSPPWAVAAWEVEV